jgi:hypothetical protein
VNILLLASHAVAEYDDVRMFHDLGYGIFAPGGYEDPGKSGEGIRPALPQVPRHDDLIAACQEQRERYGEPGRHIDWAKARLHPDVIEWADVIIAHHFIDPWLTDQWDVIKHKRVIWRTCGQSNPELERTMTPFVDDGLQVVRYSPAEERFFGEIGSFAGQHALIRFGKYPEDFGPWNGNAVGVHNITQHMQQRGDACGWGFWEEATEGLPVHPAGPGSEVLRGGIGELDYEGMVHDYLPNARAYLYTGTRPASYTLGLIEAMLSGVPVVSIGAKAWGDSWGGSRLFEAAVDVPLAERYEGEPIRSIVAEDSCFDSPLAARQALRWLLEYPDKAATISRQQRARAEALFGIQNVGPQWKAFLG